jgi:hypothetical protein
MCPKERHIPAHARSTTIALTGEDKLAIQLIGVARRRRGSNRSTMNDVLVDALWELAEREGVTKDQVAAILPAPPENDQKNNNVTEMPKMRPSPKSRKEPLENRETTRDGAKGENGP